MQPTGFMVLQLWNPTVALSQVEEQGKRPAPAEPAVSAETGILVRWQEQEVVSNATAVLNLHKVARSLTPLCFDCFDLPDLICDLLWSRESKTEAKVGFVCTGSSGSSPSDLHKNLGVKDPAKSLSKGRANELLSFCRSALVMLSLMILLKKFKHLCGVTSSCLFVVFYSYYCIIVFPVAGIRWGLTKQCISAPIFLSHCCLLSAT